MVEKREDGLRLKNQEGRIGFVSWEKLKERKTGKLHLGFGHVLTIDSAQGITSDEHINALPRGTAGITAFKAYVAESRHIAKAYTMISEASLLEAVKMRQALGENTAITTDDLWKRAAADMSEKPYKAIGLDLLDQQQECRENEVRDFMKIRVQTETAALAKRDLNQEYNQRRQDNVVKEALQPQIGHLASAIGRHGNEVAEMSQSLAPKLERLLGHAADAGQKVRAIRQARVQAGMQQRVSLDGPSMN